jgi:hypothetical protein
MFIYKRVREKGGTQTIISFTFCKQVVTTDLERERERERVMAKPHVTMEVGNDGVAVVTLINPPVNALAIPSKYLLLPLSVLTINLRIFCD